MENIILKPNKIDTIKAVSFLPYNTELCHKFIRGHKHALAKNDVLNVSSNNENWINKNGIYCIMILNEDNEPIGGVRLELFNYNRYVPILEVNNTLSKRVNDFVNQTLNREATAEFCALWVHPDYRKNDIALELSTIALAKSHMVGIKHLIFFGAQHSRKIPNTLGFVVSKEVMENDDHILYPSEKYKSVVQKLVNLEKHITSYGWENNPLQKAQYDKIRSYLLSSYGKTHLHSKHSALNIDYDLRG